MPSLNIIYASAKQLRTGSVLAERAAVASGGRVRLGAQQCRELRLNAGEALAGGRGDERARRWQRAAAGDSFRVLRRQTAQNAKRVG